MAIEVGYIEQGSVEQQFREWTRTKTLRTFTSFLQVQQLNVNELTY